MARPRQPARPPGSNDPAEVATTFVEGWNDRAPEPMNAVICQQVMVVQRDSEPT
ncbi:hypothetical protein [Haloechinothrix alba]|uniref:hypothetical protein n=1 Tax=Haloechinothrix alba TaxID=664784 RepID=UPI001595E54C|nr:hypothetical protein [Haloechinothrix alba]